MNSSHKFELNSSRLQNDTELNAHFTVQWWIGFLELFVFLIGAPLNMIVLYLASMRPQRGHDSVDRKRSITEYLIISMTSADLLFCLIHSPMMFLLYNRDLSFPLLPCMTLFGVTHASTVASSISLLWLNINKFLRLHKPLHYAMHVTKTRAFACVSLGWLASIAWALLFVLGPFSDKDEYCNVALKIKSLYVIFVVGFFVLPTIVSLGISAYVAVVVVETRCGGDATFQNRRRTKLYQSNSKLSPEPCKNNNITASNYSSYHHIQCFSDVNLTLSPASPWKHSRSNSGKSFKELSNVDCEPSNVCKQFSPTKIVKKANKAKHIRKISFVFTTTIWSTLTVLPYRIAFIVNNTQEAHSQSIAHMVSFCLFALMTLNACGNPLITIVTQRKYSVRLTRIWMKLSGIRRNVRNEYSAPEIASHIDQHRNDFPNASVATV